MVNFIHYVFQSYFKYYFQERKITLRNFCVRSFKYS
jgi:hypothetical protein